MKNAFIGLNIENGKEINYNLNNLTQHAAVLGTTGSGKTVMCKVIIEEALSQGIPVIAIDPKGDIGGLGITSKTFDFRPFIAKAEKVQTLYLSKIYKINSEGLEKITKTKTEIFTPKSSVGIQLSIIPELTSPDNFKEQMEKDHSLSASLIEPLSESLCQLAGISSEKAKSLISTIILSNWSAGKDLSIESLISQIIKPDFESLGSLNLNDFLKESERLKIASSINLILSSPSKQAWKSGTELNIEKMFQPGKLSIIDLRYTGGVEERQYVVEQVLQEIYRFILHKGGSDRLKYILYIDEIAGILPPPPSNPPCKKSLEILIRQARAFGLGIMLATQNPGDIDYKILGNIGTRFVGKLRTENDMDKVATAIGISLNTLKQALMTFKIGHFYYNNSVENKSMKMQCRWLYSYHSGPLEEKEIKWINNPETRPKFEKSLELPSKESLKSFIMKGAQYNYSSETLKKLRAQTVRYSDKVQCLIAANASNEYIPFLSVRIEPKPFKNKVFPIIGPYVFDLTSKGNSSGNTIQSYQWKQIKKQNCKILSPKRSIKKSIYSAIKSSQDQLKRRVYKSKLSSTVGDSRDSVVQTNYNFMKDELILTKRILTEKFKRKEIKILKKMEANTKKIHTMQARMRAVKSRRFIRKLFGNNRLSEKTARIKKMERIIKRLRRKSKGIQLKIKKNKEQMKDRINYLESKLYQKSHSLTKGVSYNPSRKDIVVHSSILLVPKESTL